MNAMTVSMLFVPGSRPEMIAKAAVSAADAVCIDLEDAVAPAEKAAARGHAAQALRTLDFGRRKRVLRVNAIDTPFTYRDLVDVIDAAGDRVDAVMLPKTSSANDVLFVATLLDQLEAHLGLDRRIGIEAQIETAAGFLEVRDIARASPRMRTLIFGQGDYSASMQMPAASIGERDEHDEQYPGHRYHAVMHAIVAAARAHGLGCLDGPYAAYKDAEGLERACRVARAMGFDGKQCIHPAQLDVVARVFRPSAAEIAYAEGVVAAYDAATAAGSGAVSYEGKMIDAASVRMARAVLARRRT
jgi:citrate lyase subunit beta/citryl-CoA lyase